MPFLPSYRKGLELSTKNKPSGWRVLFFLYSREQEIIGASFFFAFFFFAIYVCRLARVVSFDPHSRAQARRYVFLIHYCTLSRENVFFTRTRVG